MIPWYLILGGCLTITLLVLRVVLIRVRSILIYSDICIISSQLCTCKLVFLTIYDSLALVATILWLIAGTKFVMSLHERKNYATHNPNQDVGYFLTKNILIKNTRPVTGDYTGSALFFLYVAGLL